ASPVVTPQIKWINFNGPSEQTVERDDNAKAYTKLSYQWQDANLNGEIDGGANLGNTIDNGNEHQYPVSYPRSTPNNPVTMWTTLKLDGNLANGDQVMALTNYNGIVFGPT